MTRTFHQAVRLVPRRPRREPRPATLSFTCYRLVRILDREPGEAPYATVQVVDPANAMRVLVFKR
jgi:hypothetical protein